ncbi:hypothetical protein DIPPA_34143 [Diplonema papillatum]|nr:hypothetical protein DIPPA_34143 [Diplonema papillatum]
MSRFGMSMLNGAARSAGKPRSQVSEELLAGVYGRGAAVGRLGEAESSDGRLLHVDALGLCNFLSLHHFYGAKKASGFATRAQGLAHDVHNVLGRQRPAVAAKHSKSNEGGAASDPLPRLGEATSEHPLLGGLRCGKVMGEGRPMGDGQLWYPIMLWAFALNRLAVSTDDPSYNELAAQLVIATGLQFLQRTLPSDGADDDGKAAKSPFSLASRMNIALTERLPDPSPPRATNSLVGAFVCGVIQNGMGPTGDAKIRSSLENMEKQLVNLWLTTPSDQMRRAEADPMQIGDLLWVSSWAVARRKWAGDAGEVGVASLRSVLPTLLDAPLAGRYPPGELWMIAGASNLDSSVLAQSELLALEKLQDFLGLRMSMYGTLGKMYYPVASFGGVFQPHWIPECRDYAATMRNDPYQRRPSVAEFED